MRFWKPRQDRLHLPLIQSKRGKKDCNAYCAKQMQFPSRSYIGYLCKERVSFATYGMNQYFHVNTIASFFFNLIVRC